MKVKHIVIFFIFLFLCFFGGIIFLLKAPDLLVVESSLKKSDIIFVLGGVVKDRLPIGIGLLKEGWAEKIIIPVTKVSNTELEFYKTYGNQFSEENIIWHVIRKEGVPETKVIILKDLKSTFEEISALRKEYNRNPFNSAILVTEPLHTGRVSLLTKRIFRGKEIKFSIYYPREYMNYSTIFPEKKDYWLQTLNEYVKIVYYFLVRNLTVK